MKAFVIVLVVVYLGQETYAKPNESLNLFIRKLHRRHGDCEALAGHLDKYINWMVNREMDHLSPAYIRDMMERVSGINLFNPNEMRRVVCRMTEASTLSELKAALDELGITLHGVTIAYNFMVANVPAAIADLERMKEWSSGDTLDILDAGINVLNMLLESHLTKFDPEGTQWVADNILGGRPGGGPGRRSSQSRGAFFRRSGEDELCENLFTAINHLLTLALQEYPVAHFLSGFEEFLGFDPLDEDQMRSLICDISGVTSIQEVIEVLDNRGISDHIFAYFYYQEVSNLEYEKDYNESIQQEAEQDLPTTPGYDDEWREWQLERAAVFLPVIYGLEETGLLSLENDLVEQ